MKHTIGIIVAIVLTNSIAFAQVGLDPDDFAAQGVLNPAADVVIDTSSGPVLLAGGMAFLGVVSMDGRAVFTFDSIDVPAGVTFITMGARPLTLLSKSHIRFAGTLDASGDQGAPTGTGTGGVGGFSHDQGPGTAQDGAGAGHGGGGGGSGGPNSSNGGSPYGPSTFIGGSGGADANTQGGGGGGAVEFGAICCIDIVSGGVIDVSGGGNGLASFSQEGGGGGSGGAIYLHASSISVDGTLNARGGTANNGSSPAGGGGGGGRIWLDSGTGSASLGGTVALLGGQGGNSGFPFSDGTGGSTGSFSQSTVTLIDCNGNFINDFCDVLDATSPDLDGNWIPDDCGNGPNYCFGDGGNQLGCTNCPCMNNATPVTIGGCLNSASTSARLEGSGDPSVSLPPMSTTDLRFGLSGAPPNAFCILNSGDGLAPGSAANPCFGMNSGAQAMQFDGLRCAIMNTRRHGGRSADANGDVGVTGSPWGGSGGPPVGIAVAGAGFAVGQTRYFQAINRDDPNLSCMRGLNTSQAVCVMFQP